MVLRISGRYRSRFRGVGSSARQRSRQPRSWFGTLRSSLREEEKGRGGESNQVS